MFDVKTIIDLRLAIKAGSIPSSSVLPWSFRWVMIALIRSRPQSSLLPSKAVQWRRTRDPCVFGKRASHSNGCAIVNFMVAAQYALTICGAFDESRLELVPLLRQAVCNSCLLIPTTCSIIGVEVLLACTSVCLLLRTRAFCNTSKEILSAFGLADVLNSDVQSLLHVSVPYYFMYDDSECSRGYIVHYTGFTLLEKSV